MTGKPPDAQRGRLTLAAYAHVKARILDGRLKPGERLDVNEIVAEINVSRQPVMTALRRLSTEGFVEITPQSGCRVQMPDRDAMASFFRAFAAVEGVAAEIAAEESGPDGVGAIVAVNARMAALAEEPGLSQRERGQAYHRLNQAFHSGIHKLANSPVVSNLSESLWDKADFYIASTAEKGMSLFSTRIATSFREHEAIIAAIREGRTAEARRLMESHIRAFAQNGHA